MAEASVQTTLRFPEAFRDRLKKEANGNMTAYIMGACESAWSAAGGAKFYTQEEREAIDKLLMVLKSKGREAIMANLNFFHWAATMVPDATAEELQVLRNTLAFMRQGENSTGLLEEFIARQRDLEQQRQRLRGKQPDKEKRQA